MLQLCIILDSSPTRTSFQKGSQIIPEKELEGSLSRMDEIQDPEFRNNSTSELYYVIITYPSLALIGIVFNLLIVFALPQTNINRSTSMLMIAQTLNNALGLLVNGLLVPWQYCDPEMFNNSIGQKLPGILTLFAVFTGVAICGSLSFNRFVFIWFPVKAANFFTNKVMAVLLGFPVSLGIIFATTSAFDCCLYGYNQNGK